MDNTQISWSAGRRLVFRIAACYFILYLLSLGMSALFSPLVDIAARWLHIPGRVHNAHNGSGDSLYQYLMVLSNVCLAPLIAIVWSVADRKRPDYVLFAYWLTVVLRYILLFYMVVYGLGKVCMVQFRAPSLFHLEQPYGQSSPMGLAWRFMGYSYAFNVFTGMAEIIGGVLLLFRKTKTFGALFCMTVMGNVVAMNFCFDIPVKLFSMHLFLMAAFIAWGDVKRICAFFFTGRPVPAPATYPLINRDGRVIRIVVKCIIVLLFGIMAFVQYNSYKRYMSNEKRSPLYGVYDVVRYERNNSSVPLLITDTMLWRHLIIEHSGHAIARKMNDARILFDLKTDTAKKLITFHGEDTSVYMVMHYADTGEKLMLWGRRADDSVCMTMIRKPANSYLLTNRGFHWVNEIPFNR